MSAQSFKCVEPKACAQALSVAFYNECWSWSRRSCGAEVHTAAETSFRKKNVILVEVRTSSLLTKVQHGFNKEFASTQLRKYLLSRLRK